MTAAIEGPTLVQGVEEEDVADEIGRLDLLGHVAFEVGRVGIQEGVQINATTFVDPQTGQGQAGLVGGSVGPIIVLHL